MPAGNINERQIDLRSDASSNYATLKDFLDSVQIIPTDARYMASAVAGFSVLDVVNEIPDAPDGILPLTVGGHNSITTTGNIGLRGGIVAVEKASPLAQVVTTATNSLGHILNRVEVRDPSSKNPILVPSGADQGAMIYGLLHCLDSVNAGDAVGADTAENISLSLAYTDASGVITAFSYTGPVEFNLNLAYQRRHEPAVNMAGSGGAPADEIGGVDIEQRDFTVTAGFVSAEVLTISTGAGSIAGTSTLVTQPVGQDVALPSDFDTNVNCVAELNGIRLRKGTNVSYASADTLTINMILDIGDILTIRVPRN
jgi:hypothetical protein